VSLLRRKVRLGMVVVHTCNPNPQENEEGGSCIQGQPGLFSNILYQKKKEEEEESGFFFLQ
jgi:hypothetical protein